MVKVPRVPCWFLGCCRTVAATRFPGSGGHGIVRVWSPVRLTGHQLARGAFRSRHYFTDSSSDRVPRAFTSSRHAPALLDHNPKAMPGRKRRFLGGFGRHIQSDEWILACSCVPPMLVLRSSRRQLRRKKSALRFLPCSSSADEQTKRCFVIHVQKIGLRFRKCHHASLGMSFC